MPRRLRFSPVLIPILIPVLPIAALLWVLWVLWRSPLQPQAWEPTPNPGLLGAFTSNARLADSDRLLPDIGLGPEDIARGPDGDLYTGFADGRIVRFDSAGHSVFAHTGGRPLGMQFDRAGNLIVADGVRGLLMVTAEGEVSVLADAFAGMPMKFVDDLDIAADGTIWFSDASRRYGLADALSDLLEASATGRLMSYTPAPGAFSGCGLRVSEPDRARSSPRACRAMWITFRSMATTPSGLRCQAYATRPWKPPPRRPGYAS